MNKTDDVPALLVGRKRQKASKWINQYKVISDSGKGSEENSDRWRVTVGYNRKKTRESFSEEVTFQT